MTGKLIYLCYKAQNITCSHSLDFLFLLLRLFIVGFQGYHICFRKLSGNVETCLFFSCDWLQHPMSLRIFLIMRIFNLCSLFCWKIFILSDVGVLKLLSMEENYSRNIESWGSMNTKPLDLVSDRKESLRNASFKNTVYLHTVIFYLYFLLDFINSNQASMLTLVDPLVHGAKYFRDECT